MGYGNRICCSRDDEDNRACDAVHEFYSGRRNKRMPSYHRDGTAGRERADHIRATSLSNHSFVLSFHLVFLWLLSVPAQMLVAVDVVKGHVSVCSSEEGRVEACREVAGRDRLENGS